MIDSSTYTKRSGRHCYAVEAYVAGYSKDRITFDVIANNRDQAERIVSRDGHRVTSVNMIG